MELGYGINYIPQLKLDDKLANFTCPYNV